MENLKDKLEKALEEHQRENGLNMIGGRAQLVERLMHVLESSSDRGCSDYRTSDETGRCCP